MQPNVRLRSNVWKLTEPADPEFVKRVRGGSALKKLLRRLYPTLDPFTAARTLKLRPRQFAELAWSEPCACGVIHEGPVMKDGLEQVVFRSPHGRCEATRVLGTTVDIDRELLGRFDRRYYKDDSALVQRALATLPSAEMPLGPMWFQIPVRLTRTQHYFYHHLGIPAFSRIVNAALHRYLDDHA
jgi:hypothetical protein